MLLLANTVYRNCVELIVENALLRQQLIVFNRQVKLTQLTSGDVYGRFYLRVVPGFGSKLSKLCN